jgi:hypothetical protein
MAVASLDEGGLPDASEWKAASVKKTSAKAATKPAIIHEMVLIIPAASSQSIRLRLFLSVVNGR